MRYHTNKKLLLVITLLAAATTFTTTRSPLFAQGHTDGGHNHVHADPRHNFLSEEARLAVSNLMIQDFQGRMKPFDTLSRESVMKITKRSHFNGWEPVDLYLSWIAHSDYWFDQSIIAVRYVGLKHMLGVSEGTKHLTPNSLYDGSGRYRLINDVDVAHRKPDKEKTKTQKKLISLDERFNLFHMALRGLTLRLFPVVGDEKNTWLSAMEAAEKVGGEQADHYRLTFNEFFHAVQEQDNEGILQGALAIAAIQREHGADVLPTETQLRAEKELNRLEPFTWSSLPYLAAFPLLILAYAWSLARLRGGPLSFRNIFYSLGLLLFAGAIIFHLYGYILRWVASGRAPLSNGYESLIFIALILGIAGFFYELKGRRGSVAGPAALLTSVILGVAMLPTFDPAITPLMPVLASYWLIIHVTIITASYGFLLLAAILAMAILILHLFKKRGRKTVQLAVHDLNGLHWNVMIVGLAFLSVGTFLGGIWANESWGRYWGWDPKETWALVTILVYAAVAHFRYTQNMDRPVHIAAGSFLAITSVGMTYFGVNYFLSGLHSYAQGDSPGVPTWVYGMVIGMILLAIAALVVDKKQKW